MLQKFRMGICPNTCDVFACRKGPVLLSAGPFFAFWFSAFCCFGRLGEPFWIYGLVILWVVGSLVPAVAPAWPDSALWGSLLASETLQRSTYPTRGRER